jgi:hypothetical protein
MKNWVMAGERMDTFKDELLDSIKEADALLSISKPTTLALSSLKYKI